MSNKMNYHNTKHISPSAYLLLLICMVGICVPRVRAQESCYEQYLREHNMPFLTAEDADDSYEELKKEVLARQTMRREALFQPLLLAVDTISGACHLLSQDGSLIADVHLSLVDSMWYMWLSVDPLADKNISRTPYIYCSGNPIMLIDPDGRDDFEVNPLTRIITQRENPSSDHFYIIDANGERIDTGLDFQNGTFSIEDLFDNGTLLKSKDAFAVEQVYEYFANNTDVEWREALYGSDKNSYVGTSFLGQSNSIGAILRGRGLYFLCHSHSHPGGTTTDDRSDRKEAQRWIDAFENFLPPSFYIYTNGEYYEYNSVPDMTKILLENMLPEIPAFPSSSIR